MSRTCLILLLSFQVFGCVTSRLAIAQDYQVTYPNNVATVRSSDLQVGQKAVDDVRAYNEFTGGYCDTAEQAAAIDQTLKYTPSNVPTSTRDAARAVAISTAIEEIPESDDTSENLTFLNRAYESLRSGASSVGAYISYGVAAVVKGVESISRRQCNDPPRFDYFKTPGSFAISNFRTNWFLDSLGIFDGREAYLYLGDLTEFYLASGHLLDAAERLQGAIVDGEADGIGSLFEPDPGLLQEAVIEQMLSELDQIAGLLDEGNRSFNDYLHTSGQAERMSSRAFQQETKAYFSGEFDPQITADLIDLGLTSEQAANVIDKILNEQPVEDGVLMLDSLNEINQSMIDATPARFFSRSSDGNPADFNLDGIVSGRDFLLWQLEYGLAGSGLLADGNADQRADGADLQIWQGQYREENSIAGDFDMNGSVDGDDFLRWQRISSSLDLDDWRTNYAPQATGLLVPEPSSFAACIGLALFFFTSHRF